jgi:hypothetical protein
MPLPVPSLDDMRYDDLLAEARALIPRSFPAWTDHNPSDPGITLLELFAFLVEASLYQLDRVPERTLLRFAELTGVRRAAGESAADLLRRAVEALHAPSRAITPADVELVVTSALYAVGPPLDAPLPAGTPASLLQPLPALAVLGQPTHAQDTSLRLAGAPAVTPGDLLMLDGPGATGDRTEFVRVVAAAPTAEGDATDLTLRAPLRSEHNAGAAVARVVQPSPPATSTLARPLAPGEDVAVLEPSARLRGRGVLVLGDGDAAVCLRATGVARARAVAQAAAATHAIPDEQVIKVLLVPDQPDATAPKPSPALLRAAFQLLRERSPVTTRIRVAPPRYQPVRIAATVVRHFASLLRKDTVQHTAEAAIRRFLSPLAGGDDGTGWEFGRSVYRSELYQLLEATDGVDHVQQLLLDGDASRYELPLATDDEVAASESLVELTDVTVTILDA